LIIPEFNPFFIPGLLNAINSVIASAGKSVIIFVTDHSLKKEEEIIEHCLSWMVEGVLVSLADTSAEVRHFLPLREASIPVVMLDKVVETPYFSTLTIDGKEASRQAVQYLISHGKKAPLGIFGPASFAMTQQRIEGFKEAMQHNQLPFSGYDILCAEEGLSLENILEEKFRSTPYDAVFIMSDELLMKAIPTMQKLNLFPASLSIIAISDGITPYQIYPNITHIRHSGYEVGKAAALLLLTAIKENNPIQHTKIPVLLQEESSVF